MKWILKTNSPYSSIRFWKKKEKLTPWDIAKRYEDEFRTCLAALDFSPLGFCPLDLFPLDLFPPDMPLG